MSPSVLPPNPSIEHLKKQAKDLRKAHQSGDGSVCTLLKKYLPRFANQSDDAILVDKLSLHDAQYVVAQKYGFEHWADLREEVTQRIEMGMPVPTLESLNQKLQQHLDTLGFSTLSAYRIWCHKQGLDGSFEKSDAQLVQERALRQSLPPEPVQGHRRGQAEKIKRVYERVDTRGWLTNLFDATQDEDEREALYRLLIHIEKYSKVDWNKAAQLARWHGEWINPVEAWFPKSEGGNRQLTELTQYLLGREQVTLLQNVRLLEESEAQDEQREYNVLSQEDIDSFRALGYLRIPQAFPREVALKMQDFMWSELKRLHGFERDDPSTWTMKKWHPGLWTALKLNQTSDDPIYDEIASPRLMAAYADLLGEEKATYKQSWGAFRIVFPEQEKTTWDVGYDWDFSSAIGPDPKGYIGVYTFYSSVAHQGGGTLVVEGSHRLALAFYDRMTPNDFKQRKRVHKNRFMQSHPYFSELAGKVEAQGDRIRRFMGETTVVDGISLRVVELTSEPGDAIIYHPGLLRCESPNLSGSPRFVRG